MHHNCKKDYKYYLPCSFVQAHSALIQRLLFFQDWKMALMAIFNLLCILSFHLSLTFASDFPENSKLDTYIVHVVVPDAQLSTESVDLESWYRSFLPTGTAGTNDASRLVYSYRNVLKGFAAKLSSEEVKAMEKKKGFISAQKQEHLSLHTTHSPGFLGLQRNSGFWKDSNYGEGVTIGILDTGIKPDHPSFSDEGMPPPPAKWKGKCDAHFCNNKLIGAKYFVQDGNGSLLDVDGHGSHTAGTAAGNFVKGANVYGNAVGTAAGIAPLAHLAIYKVCDEYGCSSADVLAGMDSAIEDGVDVLSLSLGGSPKPFYSDYVALGAYSAMEKGIFVSCSAGNFGPYYGSVSNAAPWIFTVGASTMDRKIRATAMLGNNEELQGESAFQPKDFGSTMFPLVYPGAKEDIPYCIPETLNNTNVKGKVVVCRTAGGLADVIQGGFVKEAGGAAMIIINSEGRGYITTADAHVLPATHVSYVDTLKLLAYINSTKSPTATIFFNGTEFGDALAPVVAGFSSRGPNPVSFGILKPDILGPGVNILAAWPVSVENITNTKSTFNFLTGTSMSCPHLSGVAALLMSAYPHWSPAAIKSAIITTAETVNLGKGPIQDQMHRPADIFATGAGHVNPSGASNPGLIFDIGPKDYIPYLCGLNYTNRELGMILQRRVNCSIESRIPDAQLNYPSFSIVFGPSIQKYKRTVTNVGEATSSYTVKIVPPEGVNVIVEPSRLDFHELNQKETYEVTFSLLANAFNASFSQHGFDAYYPPLANASFSQGFLTWTSDKHSVRSPIAVTIGITKGV